MRRGPRPRSLVSSTTTGPKTTRRTRDERSQDRNRSRNDVRERRDFELETRPSSFRSWWAARANAPSTSRKLRSPRPATSRWTPATRTPGSCQSAITFIDGEEGHPPLPRYPDRSSSPSIRPSSKCRIYLLMYGHLPTQEAARDLRVETMLRHTMLHEDFKQMFFSALPKDAHPMAACCRRPSAPSRRSIQRIRWIHANPRRGRGRRLIRLFAKLPTLAAYSYKHSIGQPFLYPKNRPRLRRQLPPDDVRQSRARSSPSTRS